VSAVAIELVSKAFIAWVGGFAFGYTFKTIKVFFDKF